MDNGANATRAVQRFDLARSFLKAREPEPEPEPEVPAKKRTMRLAIVETAKMAAFDRVRRERERAPEKKKKEERIIVLVRTPLDTSPQHAVAAAWALVASASLVAAASFASAAAYLLCFPHL